jgi:hypothetical protein
MSPVRNSARSIVRARPRGQAMTECLVVAVILCAALLLPWVGGESPAALLFGAFTGISRNFVHFLALV